MNASPMPNYDKKLANIKGTRTLNTLERNHLLMSLQMIKQKNLSLEELQEELMEADNMEQ